MNKHFEDAWYYLRRAGDNVVRGIRHELEPVERRVRERTGGTRDSEPSRREKVRTNIREAERKAERRARDAMQDARKRIRVDRQ